MRFPLLLPSWKSRALVCGVGLMLAGVAVAIHPQNAGPAEFTIKFKLPPPKPLSPEEELKTFKLEPGLSRGARGRGADDRYAGLRQLG